MLSPGVREALCDVFEMIERNAAERIGNWSAMDAAMVILEMGESYGKICGEQIEIILNEIDVNAPRPHISAPSAAPHVVRLGEQLVELAAMCAHLWILYSIEPPSGFNPTGKGLRE